MTERRVQNQQIGPSPRFNKWKIDYIQIVNQHSVIFYPSVKMIYGHITHMWVNICSYVYTMQMMQYLNIHKFMQENISNIKTYLSFVLYVFECICIFNTYMFTHDNIKLDCMFKNMILLKVIWGHICFIIPRAVWAPLTTLTGPRDCEHCAAGLRKSSVCTIDHDKLSYIHCLATMI